MIRLIKRRLIIPRGDTGSFSIPTIGSVGESDIAIFGIFDSLTRETVVMKKVQATENFLTISLNSEDTINLKPKKYNWDITIYKSPEYDEEGELIGAAEVNSYYSAFKLPICEITEVALDMNKDRWRTSVLTLNPNDYQAANNIQTVYPWENIQRSQLSQQILKIAQDFGFEGTEEELWKRFSSGLLIITNEFPIEGNEQTLYFNKESETLYSCKIINEEDPIPVEVQNATIIRNEGEGKINLYTPIHALGIIG